MSFDVYFQGFAAGDAAEGGGAQIRAVLEPRIVEEDREFFRVRAGDGTADIYLHDSGMMANHVSGSDPWELLVTAARAANWVIMPVGLPMCLTAEAQRTELPEGLGDDAVVVGSGAELQALIEAS